ncbi:hypothetical protein Nhal_1747 [Nitrosococcus halophilus Nc 4]|uniref:Uncharacterized protein n=1 Tax=Nitrosococcus halophilus (strain Nc4) TaxID=472759 RepID=D5C2X9_NITHN|nr:hypothetical protein Nhal_1747 [Nitrosococcus halophilus Nc 4]
MIGVLNCVCESRLSSERQWFSEKDWEQWDKQIEEEAKSGKLDFLIKEAVEEKSQGRLKEL